MATLTRYENLFNQGVQLLDTGEPEKALTSFQQAIEIKPDFIPAWVYNGICLEQLERYEEAISCYNQAININPNIADLWYNKSATYCKLKQYNNALACINRVLDIEPDHALAKTTQSLILATPPILNPTILNPDPQKEPSKIENEAEIALTAEAYRQLGQALSVSENELERE